MATRANTKNVIDAKPPTPTRRIVIQLLAYVTLYCVVFWFCYKRIDLDFGWSLQAGRYILSHGIPKYDIFTYTARQFVWINHEWASDAFLALLYNIGGMALSAAVYAAIWLTAVVLAARRSLATSILAVIGLFGFLTVRSIAFTALFLALELYIWYEQPQKYWLVLPLFLIWSNLHAGFVLGLVLLAFLVVWEKKWREAWLIPIATLVTFVNPYGPRLYVEIWRTLSDTSLVLHVSEWEPLQLNGGAWIYILPAMASVYLFEPFGSSRGLIFFCLLFAALTSRRMFVPFVIISASSLTLGIDEASKWVSKKFKITQSRFQAIASSALLIVLLFVLGRYLPLKNSFPVAAVQSLRSKPCIGNIFNEYDFGGYLIWQLPGVPVYIDGRMASWRSPQGLFIDKFYQVMKGGSSADQQFSEYNIRCAILYDNPSEKGLITWLIQKGWSISAQDSSAVLWRAPR